MHVTKEASGEGCARQKPRTFGATGSDLVLSLLLYLDLDTGQDVIRFRNLDLDRARETRSFLR